MSRIFFKKQGQKPSIFSTLGLIIAGLAFLALLLAGPIYRLGIFGDPAHNPSLFDLQFKIITVAMRLVLVAAVFTLGGILHGGYSSRARTSWRGVWAVILVSAMAWPLTLLFYRAETAPVLHDISTAPEQAISFTTLNERQYETADPSDVLGGRLDPSYLLKHRNAYPGLGSTPLGADVYSATKLAMETAVNFGWSIVSSEPQNGHIEAIYESPWFGFRSFIIISLREKDALTFLDIRAVSEMGHTDFGINADLIDAFTTALRSRTN